MEQSVTCMQNGKVVEEFKGKNLEFIPKAYFEHSQDNSAKIALNVANLADSPLVIDKYSVGNFHDLTKGMKYVYNNAPNNYLKKFNQYWLSDITSILPEFKEINQKIKNTEEILSKKTAAMEKAKSNYTYINELINKCENSISEQNSLTTELNFYKRRIANGDNSYLEMLEKTQKKIKKAPEIIKYQESRLQKLNEEYPKAIQEFELLKAEEEKIKTSLKKLSSERDMQLAEFLLDIEKQGLNPSQYLYKKYNF